MDFEATTFLVLRNRSIDNVQECLLLSISKLMKVKVFYNKEHHFWLQIFYSYGHVFVMILKRKNPGTINWDVTWWLLCKKSGVLYYSTTMVLQICALPSWMNWSLAGQINWPQASVMARASPNLIAPPLTRLRLHWPAIDKIAMRNQFWEARNCFPRDSPHFILSFWRIPN